jgi:hypothetical protein
LLLEKSQGACQDLGETVTHLPTQLKGSHAEWR